MSAYKRIECNLVDKNTLVEALKQLGLNPRVTEKPDNLHGYQGDQREQTAEIIVNRVNLNTHFTGYSNDLGFNWNPTSKQYEMIISEYDAKSHIVERVKQSYMKVAIEKALVENGFNIESTTPAKNLLNRRRRTKVQIVANKLI